MPVLPEAAKKEGVRACKPCAPGLKTAPGKTNRRPKAGGLDERHAPLRPWCRPRRPAAGAGGGIRP
ncbi:hypothetical protein NZJ93_11260 [Desulfofundulus thermocisternus]|nr:hypothetical protein [Desulfofundulus thermocisternus]